MTDPLSDLPEYLSWANLRTLQMYRSAKPSVEAGQIFSHLLGAETLWANRILGRASDGLKWPFKDFVAPNEFEARIVSNVDLYRTIRDSIELNAPIEFTDFQGDMHIFPLSGILMHVNVHGAFHRGQIVHALQLPDADILNLDFMLFQWHD
jgi:uncharacterized damage-inducible protein DinB